jgi:hypothetical protein
MVLWVKPGEPCPCLRLMQAQETLWELMQEVLAASSGSTS